MVFSTKFMFGSRLCARNILASHTSFVLNGNHLINFVNKSVSVPYLISYNYCRLFTREKRTKNIFFIRVLDDTLNLSPKYPLVR